MSKLKISLEDRSITKTDLDLPIALRKGEVLHQTSAFSFLTYSKLPSNFRTSIITIVEVRIPKEIQRA